MGNERIKSAEKRVASNIETVTQPEAVTKITTMKAAVIHEFGDVDVLKYEDIKKPTAPGPGIC